MALPQPAPVDDLSSLMSDELSELRKEVDAMLAHGLSEEEAQDLLSWVKEVEGKVKAVASLLADPSPAGVAVYLRTVAAGLRENRSRRYAASSVRLLKAVLARVSR